MARKRGRSELATKPHIHQKRVKLNQLNDIVRLCNLCATMINESNELKSLISPREYLHSSKEELFASARKGCPICFWVHDFLQHMWIENPSAKVHFHALDSSRSESGYNRPNRLVATVGPLLDPCGKFPNIYFSISGRPKVFETTASLKTYLQASQTKLIDMSSLQTMRQVRSQLEECQISHRKCIKNNAVSLLPTLVLDVGLLGDPLIRLHRSTPQQYGSFVALSYCWGRPGSQQCQTTKSTVDKHYTGIALQDLSLSIQDAVEVTRQLGIQYLWVDALCIVQHSEDTEAEISLMGTIYKNATLTLAASSALHADAGFLRKVPAETYFKLPYQLSDEGMACIEVSLMGASFEDPFKSGRKRPFLLGSQSEPLDRRIWPLQESLLSHRLLSFGTKGMKWRCHSEAITKVRDGVKKSKALPLGVFNNTKKEQSEANLQRDQVNLWHSIVKDYSRRELNVRSDYSRAISEIVGKLASYWNDEYLAGMWRRTLVANLAWHIEKDMLWYFEQYYLETGRYSPLDAPSWSWLSKIAGVSFLKVEDVRLKLVDCRLLRSSGSPCSDFSHSSLTVFAACFEFRYDMRWRQFHYWLNTKAYEDDMFKFSPWPEKDSKIALEGLLLGFSGESAIGIIVERISGPETLYRRRGLWRNKATLADHTHMWNMENNIPGCSFKELTII
ncbi:heterokaryon incompatibility protein-domain-containing protein, partial [Tricladium varicosporioides]